MGQLLLALALACTGCRALLGFETATEVDTDPPNDVAVTIDMPSDTSLLPCVADGIDLTSIPLDDRVFDTSITLDTTAVASCTHVATLEGVEVCIVAGDHVVVEANVTIFAIGSRPLVVFACKSFTISGHVDASSTAGRRGAAPLSACVTSIPETDLGGGGGAGGGSFVGKGGDGGTGDSDSSLGDDGPAVAGIAAPAVPVPTKPRGGCSGGTGGSESNGGGQGGVGGAPGGALWLVGVSSVHVSTSGAVLANGAGGAGGQVQAGGGGGGSGGWIRIAAPTIVIEGVVAANGGGGGGGGARISGVATPGQPGQDGRASAAAASGGPGAGMSGTGGVGASVNGPGPGATSVVGGGGGGGGAGAIILAGAVSPGGTVSPPPD